MSSVLIYRKCAKRNICLLHIKTALETKYEPIGGGGGRPTRPLESATVVILKKKTKKINALTLSSVARELIPLAFDPARVRLD